MKCFSRGLRFLAATIIAALVVGLGTHTSAASASIFGKNILNGRYVFYNEGFEFAGSGEGTIFFYNITEIGVLSFDGRGHLSGNSTSSVVVDGFIFEVCTYQISGTYGVNSNGTGTADLNGTVTSDTASQDCLDFQGKTSLVIENADGSAAKFFFTRFRNSSRRLVRDSPGEFLGGSGAGVSAKSPTFGNVILNGKYAFHDEGSKWVGTLGAESNEDFDEIGVLSFDGHGHLSGNSTSATISFLPRYAEHVCSYDISGTYEVKPDGTGTADLDGTGRAGCPDFRAKTSFAIESADGGVGRFLYIDFESNAGQSILLLNSQGAFTKQ
jgi:hypothetical protein